VILVVYDMPYPEPLHQVRPIAAPFGMALVLGALPSPRTRAALSIELSASSQGPSTLAEAALEDLRQNNPAARGLPLLVTLATRSSAELAVDYVAGNQLQVGVRPC
jgi:3-deoxy-D-manno-octulosonic-acid transferase